MIRGHMHLIVRELDNRRGAATCEDCDHLQRRLLRVTLRVRTASQHRSSSMDKNLLMHVPETAPRMHARTSFSQDRRNSTCLLVRVL